MRFIVENAAWEAIISILLKKTSGVYRGTTIVWKDLKITGNVENLSENIAVRMASIGGLWVTLPNLHEMSLPLSSKSIMVKIINNVVPLRMSFRYCVRDSYVSLYYVGAKGLARQFLSTKFTKIDLRHNEAKGFLQEVLALTCRCRTWEQPINRISSITSAPSCTGLV